MRFLARFEPVTIEAPDEDDAWRNVQQLIEEQAVECDSIVEVSEPAEDTAVEG